MKKVIVMLAVLAMAVPAMAQLAGTGHDFSGEAFSDGEICGPCHTPHNANASTEAPLWARANSGASYTAYTGFDMDATVGAPAGLSLMCLSCHDGTIELDTFVGSDGTLSADKMGDIGVGSGDVGTNLSSSHPISIVYNTLLISSDSDLNDPATEASGLGGTVEEDLLVGTAGSATVECSSCHDVHNGAGVASLLVKSNAASALCTTCHAK